MTAVKSASMQAPLPWWLVLLQGITAGLLGLMLVLHPAVTAVVLIQFLGAYWLVGGLLTIVLMFIDTTAWGWKLLSGLLGTLAGVYILNHPLLSTVLIPTTLIIIMGVQGLLIGAITIFQGIRGAGLGAIILGVISMVFGVLLLGSPLLTAAMLPFVVGVWGLVSGVAAIVQAFRMRKA